MPKELEEKVFMAIFSNDFMKRREASEYVKKYYGDKAYKLLQEYWKRRFVCMNWYGYVDITKKGYDYWYRFRK